MIVHKQCPICQNKKTIRIGEQNVESKDPPGNIQEAGTNVILANVLKRRDLVVTTMQCKGCRHVYLAQSFDSQELNRLYSKETIVEIKKQYRVSEKVSGKSWAEQNNINPEEQSKRLAFSKKYRPWRLFDYISKTTKRSHFPVICDFGAKTGEMTSGFRDCQRYIFDKNLDEISNSDVAVLYTMDAFVQHGPYDLIILSHVLEHIVEPLDLIKKLHASLRPDGLIYIEVPVEYCGAVIKRKGIVIGEHVNFFTKKSLLKCLESSGFGYIYPATREFAPYGECQNLVYKILARKESIKAHAMNDNWPEPSFLGLLVDAFLIWHSRRRPFIYESQ